jgi:hypothetical protein
MFQKEKKKLKGLLLHSNWRTSLQELAGLTVQFESAKGNSALPLTRNCHVHAPTCVPPSLAFSEVPGVKFTISRNPNNLLRFPVHSKFSRSWFDEHFAAINHLLQSSGQKWRG